MTQDGCFCHPVVPRKRTIDRVLAWLVVANLVIWSAVGMKYWLNMLFN